MRARGARGILLTLGGLALAAVFAMPYVIMLLGSLRTSQDNKTSPPSFWPRQWQWDT